MANFVLRQHYIEEKKPTQLFLSRGKTASGIVSRKNIISEKDVVSVNVLYPEYSRWERGTATKSSVVGTIIMCQHAPISQTPFMLKKLTLSRLPE